MKARIILALLAVASATGSYAADKWTSADGRAISAEFVKLEGDTVTLLMNGTAFDVPLANLSAESQAFAAWHEGKRGEWVADRLSRGSISEEDLQRLVSIDRAAAEGRRFLVEGVVKAARRPGGLARRAEGEIEIELSGGTRTGAILDDADGRLRKLQFGLDTVSLTKARSMSSSGPSNYTLERVLVKPGDPIVIRATVRNGRIEGEGRADGAEVTEARMRSAVDRGGLSAEQFAGIERVRIRLEFLEAALAGGSAGSASGSANVVNPGGGIATVIGSATFHFSDAEMSAMRQEADLLRAQIRTATE